MTKVTEVQIQPIKPRNGLIGFASFVIDGKYYVSSIGVYSNLSGGYRITFPTKKIGQNNLNIFHPINSEAGDAIKIAVVKQAAKLFEERDYEVK